MIATARAINLTNLYMVAIGALVHRYSTIFGTFRLSYWGIINLVLINSLYVICLWTHYAKQEQVQVLQLLSQPLYDCVYAHLYSGVGNCIVIAIEYRSYLAFSRKVATQVTNTIRENGRTSYDVTPTECFLFYKMWMNTCILLSLVVYNLCTMDLRSLTLTRVLLIIGLAYPHLLIANVLRFVTVQSLLINEMWADTNAQLESFKHALDTNESDNRNTPISVVKSLTDNGTNCTLVDVNNISTVSAGSREKSLSEILTSYELYQALYVQMQRLVRNQVANLIMHHSIVIFVAVHIYVKVRLLWNVVLTEIDLHLLRTNFITFLVMIVNDYVCLLITSKVCQREINRTMESLCSILRIAKHEHIETLRSAQNFLLKNLTYKYDGVLWFLLFRVNGRNFLMMVFVHLVLAAIVGMYQFFNTKIDEVD